MVKVSCILHYMLLCRGVAVAIFSLRFHVWYFPVGYRLTVSHLTKQDNQIVFLTVKPGTLTQHICVLDSDWLNDEIYGGYELSLIMAVVSP